MRLALFVLSLLLPSSTASADEAGPRIDLDDPCATEGMPAVSADGRLVALVRCWSDLSDASDVTFRLVRVRDGRVVRTIFLQGAGTGGDDLTPAGLVRRAVRHANRVLAQGGFRSLTPVEDRESVLPAAGPLPSFPSHPYCCGVDQPDWDTATCALPAVVHGAWADATAAVLVLETGAYDGPDGCEEGPDFRVVSLPR